MKYVIVFAVLAVELLNPYNGIDATRNERHLIRDVQGQPLRRGICPLKSTSRHEKCGCVVLKKLWKMPTANISFRFSTCKASKTSSKVSRPGW